MMDLTHLRVGDVVMMRDANEGRSPHRKGPRKVASVGRTLFAVVGDNRKFERATGRVKDRYRHTWIQTMDDYEAGVLVVAATERMRSVGVEFTIGCRLTNAQKLRVVAAVTEAVAAEPRDEGEVSDE